MEIIFYLKYYLHLLGLKSARVNVWHEKTTPCQKAFNFVKTIRPGVGKNN